MLGQCAPLPRAPPKGHGGDGVDGHGAEVSALANVVHPHTWHDCVTDTEPNEHNGCVPRIDGRGIFEPAAARGDLRGKLRPGCGSRWQGDRSQTPHIIGADPLVSAQRVVRLHDDDPLASNRWSLLDRRVVVNAEVREVGAVFTERLDALRCRVHGHVLELDVRIPTAKGGERPCHEVAQGCPAGGDAQSAEIAGAESLDLLFGPLEFGQDASRRVRQDAPGGRWLHPEATALEQDDAELALQPPDLLAHSRLRDVGFDRDGTQAPRFTRAQEAPEVLKSHEINLREIQETSRIDFDSDPVKHARVNARLPDLGGLRIVVTGGGTVEPIDALALAVACLRRGADVTLISTAPDPTILGLRSIQMTAVSSRRDAVVRECATAHILVMVPAVADFLHEVGEHVFKVGFSAECDQDRARTLAKFDAHGFDLICSNPIDDDEAAHRILDYALPAFRRWIAAGGAASSRDGVFS